MFRTHVALSSKTNTRNMAASEQQARLQSFLDALEEDFTPVVCRLANVCVSDAAQLHFHHHFHSSSSCLVPVSQVPDELTRYIIQQSGISCSRSTGEETNREKTALDERTLRLFSLAGQKFLSDLIDEACVVQQNRMQAPAKFQQAEGFYSKSKENVLLTDDLAVAMNEYGLKLYRPSVFHGR